MGETSNILLDGPYVESVWGCDDHGIADVTQEEEEKVEEEEKRKGLG